MATNASAVWPKILLAVVVAAIVQFIYTGYKVRSRMNCLRKMGLPMPPWSWLSGHLPFFQAQLAKYPSNVLISVVMKDIAQRYFPDTEMYYLDLWPMLPPTLWVGNAAASAEVDKRLNIKPGVYKSLFQPLTGGPSLLDTNGEDWKYWRGIMNPGFAPGYVMSKAAHFIDSGDIFCQILEEKAKEGKVFQLEAVSMRLTLEIVIKMALNLDQNHQINFHPVPTAMLAIMPWSVVGNPLLKLHPIRPFIIAYYNYIINFHMVPELERRYIDYMSEPTSKKSQSIFTLTLSAHRKYQDLDEDNNNTVKATPKPTSKTPDKAFMRIALSQIRMLVIAAFDTTTSILVYTQHMLSQNPPALTRLREEHTRVFGPSPSQTSTLLHSNPQLLNALPYTLAVIKETMRLYPPGGAYRAGSPTVHLTDQNGTSYPTDGYHVSVAHHTIHYNANVYQHPELFRPERWINAGVELGGWRPFERGPRNCLGQDVAMVQLKVMLVLTARRFKITPAYEEWDGLEAGKRTGGLFGWSDLSIAKLVGGKQREKQRYVHGERAYQADIGGARPALGYPCRVELVDG